MTFLKKYASTPLPHSADGSFDQPGTVEANRLDTAKFLTTAPLAMLALGAMARGGLGIRDMFTSHKLPSPQLIGSTQYVSLPQIRHNDEEEEVGQRTKIGAEGNLIDQIVDPLARNVVEPLMPHGFIGGDSAHTIAQNPIAGAALPLGLLGLYGGWKGTDMLLDSRRKQEQESELSRVKREYMQALQGKHAALHKVAEVAVEKLADLSPPAAPPAAPPPATIPSEPGLVDKIPLVGGQYAGMYGNYALASGLAAALGAGALSYNHFNSQSRRKVLDEALKRRAAQDKDQLAPVFAYTE